MRIFYPDMYVSNLKHINLDQLKKQGIKALFFDLDNTLVPWGSEDLTDDTVQWFVKLRDAGFKTCVISNGNRNRVSKLCSRLGIPGIHKAAKPSRRAFRQAMRKLNVRPNEVAMVGDQIFTDVLGANRLGLYTILVRPLSSHEFIGTRINRKFEKLVLRRFKRKHYT